MTMRALYALCVVVVVVWGSGGVRGAPVEEENPASEEQVNVLMFGVLQFGESLRSTFQSTEAKLARLINAVRNTEGLVRRLDQQTLEAKQAEAQIKEGIQHLQVQTADLKSTAERTKGKVQQVQQGDLELKTKLMELESTLRRANPDSVRLLKEAAQKHSRLLRDLMDWTQHQKKSLQLQSQQLTELQKQNGS